MTKKEKIAIGGAVYVVESRLTRRGLLRDGLTDLAEAMERAGIDEELWVREPDGITLFQVFEPIQGATYMSGKSRPMPNKRILNPVGRGRRPG